MPHLVVSGIRAELENIGMKISNGDQVPDLSATAVAVQLLSYILKQGKAFKEKH